MKTFTIMPLLGRRTDVPPDDARCFRFPNPENPGLCYTHDVGGINFDLTRQKRSCVKSKGKAIWSNTANATTSNCLGLFELNDGTNRNHVYVDGGNIYIYDSSRDPAEMKDVGDTAFASDATDIFSFERIGDYFVFADRAEHTPYMWKHGEANLLKFIGASGGTEYKFRYLVSFSRRLLGLYSDQTDGKIDIRYSKAWPDTAIGHADMGFPAANQLWVPNDDTIVGGATMGLGNCFVYCDDSIQQIVYYPDYDNPFQIFTIVPKNAGIAGHQSIVNLGDRHFVYSTKYGFCEYRGGRTFPYGKPISDPIEEDIAGINEDYTHLIQGVYIPVDRRIVWTVPANASSISNRLFFYDVDTKNWEIEDKTAQYVDRWRIRSTYTWNTLTTDYGAGATWNEPGGVAWSYFAAIKDVLMFGKDDGIAYYRTAESDSGSDFDGYRVEPILSFGNPRRLDSIHEIWFSIAEMGNFSIDVYHRSGETVGEIENADWSSVGSISANTPSEPKIDINTNMSRLHQIKWGCNLKNEKFNVNRITIKYNEGSVY